MICDLQKIQELIDENQTFLTVSHVSPDGDAIGSVLALHHFLKKIGKKSTVALKDPVPQLWAFLPGSDEICSFEKKGLFDSQYDVLFIIDIGDVKRVSLPLDPQKVGKITIGLDHHISNLAQSDFDFIDSEACSTTAILYDLISVKFPELSAEIGECIYTGLIADTGGFRYENTTPRTFEYARKLTELGVNVYQITDKVFNTRKEGSLRLLGKAIHTMEIGYNGKIAWTIVSAEDFDSSGALKEDTEGIVNYLRSIQSVEVAILFKELSENSYKLSLRSKHQVDVNAIAKQFGGGGHPKASGCVLEGTLEEITSKVIAQVAKHV